MCVILFIEELRKEKRDEAFCGKRVRLGEDDNLEYEFTASDVMGVTDALIMLIINVLLQLMQGMT